MALVKTLQPPTVALAENPVLFGFSTNNMYAHPGTRAEFTIQINGMQGVGQFELIIDGIYYPFQFVPTPGNNPGDLPEAYIGVGFGTYDQYLSQVKNEFQKHPFLAKHYTITMQGAPFTPYILFVAKALGAKYTIALNAAPSSVVKAIAASNVTGVNQVMNPFFGVYLQCYIDGELTGEDLLQPNETGELVYDVSAYLKATATPSFTWPITTILKNRTDLMRRFWVMYAERYGMPAQIYKLQSTYGFISYALPGGAGYMQNAKYQNQDTSFWEELQYTKQFLTWQPKTKTVKPDQTEKLFWLNNLTIPSVRLMCELIFFDDLTTVQSLSMPPVLTAQYNIVELSFMLNDFLEQLSVTGRLYKATIYLVNPATGEAVSEKRTYLSDYRNELHTHQFVWRNSFGMYDTDLFAGKYQQSVKDEKQIFSFTNRYSFNNTNAPTRVLKSTEVEFLSTSTGWIEDKSRANWLRELLLSREVYEIIDHVLHPIVITSGDVEIVTEGKTLHNIHFDYTRAYTDEHHSKQEGWISAKFIQSFNQAHDPSINTQ